VSQTGSLGGSRLATDPTSTTLLDVYQALESPGVFSLHRQPPSQDCPVGVNIETVLGNVLTEVDSAVELVLSKITISDVVQRLKPCVASKNGRKKEYSRETIDLSPMRAGAKSRKAKAFRTA
jgi:DNA-binding IscR family transcriptional regulator